MTSSVIRAMICPTKRNGAAKSLLPAYAEELLKHYPVFNRAGYRFSESGVVRVVETTGAIRQGVGKYWMGLFAQEVKP